MIVLGLTGGIGMGKSNAAGMFRRLGLPVFDADAAVHRLQGRGGRAVGPIGAAFPGTVQNGRVVREALRNAVLGKPEEIRKLERIVHPMVRDEERRFLAAARRAGKRAVVLDIPLLFETGGRKRIDSVVVVSAPAALQRARVLARRTMTPERLAAILALQMPDARKRRRADVVIRTGLSRHETQRAIRRLVQRVRAGETPKRRGKRWALRRGGS
jgi:dephospho-CoA kinase